MEAGLPELCRSPSPGLPVTFSANILAKPNVCLQNLTLFKINLAPWPTCKEILFLSMHSLNYVFLMLSNGMLHLAITLLCNNSRE